MSTFTETANAHVAAHPDEVRRHAWQAFTTVGLPTTSDEVWRYAPLNKFTLDAYSLDAPAAASPATPFALALAERAGTIVTLVNGIITDIQNAPEGLSISQETGVQADVVDRYAGDAFALLNCALTPNPVVLRVADNATITEPVLILSSTTARSSFPQMRIELGRSSSLSVVEYLDGGADALVVPLTDFQIGDNASLHMTTYQRLATSAWHVARSTAFLHRDSRMHQSVLSIGGGYNRSRNDAHILGTGAANELRTTFLGAGEQVHDFRTRQFHIIGRSTSTLLSKGAVADNARSIYTGLIEIEKGAKRTDARQTNHNLLLSPHAHADSVPNLDIRENDVMCAHASSVGPLDELQRWYLESRGVSRHDAERLMIQGFFYEMLSSLPAALSGVVEDDLRDTLANVNVVTP